jgi:hypothetical protein
LATSIANRRFGGRGGYEVGDTCGAFLPAADRIESPKAGVTQW